MPVEYFIRFQGKCYDVGTRLKFKRSTAKWERVLEGKIEWIGRHVFYIRLTDGCGCELSKVWPLDNIIIEIIEPVYYEEPQKVYVRGGPCPPEGELFVGWVWYIVIMLVGIIFKDRFAIWVFATVVFFLWKNGFLNGGKK